MDRNKFAKMPWNVRFDRYDVYCDHALYVPGVLDDFMAENYRKITILRDPVARKMSGFFFLHSGKSFDRFVTKLK